MANDDNTNPGLAIATFNSLNDISRGMSARGLETPRGGRRQPDKATQDRYDQILQKLQAETETTSPNVLITVQDRDASVLQSLLAQQGAQGRSMQAGGIEAQFGEGMTGGDVWGWIKSTFDHIDQSRWRAIKRPPNNTVGTIADKGKIAIVGDWGTNLYGAPVSAAAIRKAGNFEMVLHLGDIYYSGTVQETRERFLSVWPEGAGKVSRALNGNHEMYSGGYAYFDEILPAFNQPSSYFAVQNEHFLLVGLDTAHTDHALDAQQVSWLNAVIAGAGKREVILFSHHQLFSRLDAQGPMLQSALAGLFQKSAIGAWYWGHEHLCVIYDKHPTLNLLGRCIGHGGIPSPRKYEVVNAPIQDAAHGITWRRLDPTANSPQCFVLDGRNPLVPGEEDKFGPHGYLTLDFDGPALIERVHLPEGTVIFENRVF